MSAKRRKSERIGVHAWHPYYAGFSEAFVESAIDFLGLKAGNLILDPWNGSGTTTFVSGRRSIAAIGIDVNPVMGIFSMAKSSVIPSQELLILNCVETVCTIVKVNNLEVNLDDPLLQFMSPSVCAVTRAFFEAIRSITISDLPQNAKAFRALTRAVFPLNPIRCFLLAALFKCARQSGGYAGGSNPTWVRAMEKKPRVTLARFKSDYVMQIKLMIQDLRQDEKKTKVAIEQLTCIGDSRALPIKTRAIDAVITSPPYLTRIDYAVSTKPELLILGNEVEFRSLREQTMGAPVIVNKLLQKRHSWGPTCNKLLNAVANHGSKAARSYYLIHMLQYFSDAEKSLSEIARVLKPDSRALVVVQSSYFKELEIDLAKIYIEMSAQFKMKADVAFRESIRGHMAHVNLKSNRYLKNKQFQEQVVMLTAVQDI